jgi:hypothetical protein
MESLLSFQRKTWKARQCMAGLGSLQAAVPKRVMHETEG